MLASQREGGQVCWRAEQRHIIEELLHNGSILSSDRFSLNKEMTNFRRDSFFFSGIHPSPCPPSLSSIVSLPLSSGAGASPGTFCDPSSRYRSCSSSSRFPEAAWYLPGECSGTSPSPPPGQASFAVRPFSSGGAGEGLLPQTRTCDRGIQGFPVTESTPRQANQIADTEVTRRRLHRPSIVGILAEPTSVPGRVATSHFNDDEESVRHVGALEGLSLSRREREIQFSRQPTCTEQTFEDVLSEAPAPVLSPRFSYTLFPCLGDTPRGDSLHVLEKTRVETSHSASHSGSTRVSRPFSGSDSSTASVATSLYSFPHDDLRSSACHRFISVVEGVHGAAPPSGAVSLSRGSSDDRLTASASGHHPESERSESQVSPSTSGSPGTSSPSFVVGPSTSITSTASSRPSCSPLFAGDVSGTPRSPVEPCNRQTSFGAFSSVCIQNGMPNSARAVPFQPPGVSGLEGGLGREEGACGVRRGNNSRSQDNPLSQREQSREGYASDSLLASSSLTPASGAPPLHAAPVHASPAYSGQHSLYLSPVPRGSTQSPTAPGSTAEEEYTRAMRTGGCNGHHVTQSPPFASPHGGSACMQQPLSAVGVGSRAAFVHPSHQSAPFSEPPLQQHGMVGEGDVSAQRPGLSFQSQSPCLRTGGRQEEFRMHRGSETQVVPPPVTAHFQAQQHTQPGDTDLFRPPVLPPDAANAYHASNGITVSSSGGGGAYYGHTRVAVHGPSQVVQMPQSSEQGNTTFAHTASSPVSENCLSKVSQGRAVSSHSSPSPVMPRGNTGPQSQFASHLPTTQQSLEGGPGHLPFRSGGQGGDGESAALQSSAGWGGVPSATPSALQSDSGIRQEKGLPQQYSTGWGIPAQKGGLTTCVDGSASAVPFPLPHGATHQGVPVAEHPYPFGGGETNDVTRLPLSSASVQTPAGVSEVAPSPPPGEPRACPTGNTSQKQSQYLSPVPGVVFDRGGEKWIARWSENGRPFKKTFAVGKHGFDAAKRMAEESRLQALHAKQKQCSLREKVPSSGGGGSGDGKSKSGIMPHHSSADGGETPAAAPLTQANWCEGKKDTQPGRHGYTLPSGDTNRVLDSNAQQDTLVGSGEAEKNKSSSSLPPGPSPCADTWPSNEPTTTTTGSSREIIPGTQSGNSQTTQSGGTVQQSAVRAGSSVNNTLNAAARDKFSSSRAKANAAANARRRKKREEERAARQAERLALSQSQNNTVGKATSGQLSCVSVNTSGDNKSGEYQGPDSKSYMYSSERSSLRSEYPVFSHPSPASPAPSSSHQAMLASSMPFTFGSCVTSSQQTGCFRSDGFQEKYAGIPRPMSLPNGRPIDPGVGHEGYGGESQLCTSPEAAPPPSSGDFMSFRYLASFESGESQEGQQNQMLGKREEKRGEGGAGSIACPSATARGVPVGPGVKRQQQQLAKQVQKQQYLLHQQEQLLQGQESLLASLMQRRWQRVTQRWRSPPTLEAGAGGGREVLPAGQEGDRVGRDSKASTVLRDGELQTGLRVLENGACVSLFKEGDKEKEGGLSCFNEERLKNLGQEDDNMGEEVNKRKRRRTTSQCWPIPSHEELKAAEAFTLLGLQRKAAAMEGNLFEATVLADRKIQSCKARILKHKSEETACTYESRMQEGKDKSGNSRDDETREGCLKSGEDEEAGPRTAGPEGGTEGSEGLEKEEEKMVTPALDAKADKDNLPSNERTREQEAAGQESQKHQGEADKPVTSAKEEESCPSNLRNDTCGAGVKEEEERSQSASQEAEEDGGKDGAAQSCEEDSVPIQLEKSSPSSDTSTRLDSSRLSSPQEDRETCGLPSSSFPSPSSSFSPPSSYLLSPPPPPAPLLFPCTTVQIEDLCLSTLLTLGRVRPEWRRRDQREPFGWHVTQIKPSLVLPCEFDFHPSAYPSRGLFSSGGHLSPGGSYPCSVIENSSKGNLAYSDLLPSSQDGNPSSSLCLPPGSISVSDMTHSPCRYGTLDVYIHILRPLFSSLGSRLEYLHLSSTDIASIIQGLDLTDQSDVIDSVLESLDRLYYRSQFPSEPILSHKAGEIERRLQEESDLSPFAVQSPHASICAEAGTFGVCLPLPSIEKRKGGVGERIPGDSQSWQEVSIPVKTPPCTPSPSSPSHKPCPFSAVTDSAGGVPSSSGNGLESSPPTQVSEEGGRTSDTSSSSSSASAAFNRNVPSSPIPCTRSSSQTTTVPSSVLSLPQQGVSKTSAASLDPCDTMVLAYNPEAKVLRQLNYLAVGTRVYVQISVLEEALNRRSVGGAETPIKPCTNLNKSYEKNGTAPVEDTETKEEATTRTGIKTEKGTEIPTCPVTQSPFENDEVASPNENTTADARVGSQYVVAELTGRRFQLPAGETLTFRLLSLPTCHLPPFLSSSANFSFSPGQVCHFFKRAKMCLMRFSEKEMMKRQRGTGNVYNSFFLLAPPVLCIPTVSCARSSAGSLGCSAGGDSGGGNVYTSKPQDSTGKTLSALSWSPVSSADDDIPAFLFSPFSVVPSSGLASNGATAAGSSESGSLSTSVRASGSTASSADSRGGAMASGSSGKVSPCPSAILPVAGAPPGFPGSFSANFPGTSAALPSRSSKPLCCPAPQGVDKICRCKCNHRRQELQTEIRRKLKQDRKACMALISDFPDLLLVLGSKFTSGRSRAQSSNSSASAQKKAVPSDGNCNTSTAGGGEGSGDGKNPSGECLEGNQVPTPQRPPPSVPVGHGLAFLACARTCQLEILAYLVGVDPWKYAKNRHEAPNPELIPGIVARYKAAVKTREYAQMLKNWEAEQAKERSFAFQEIKPFDVSVGGRGALFQPLGTGGGKKSNQTSKSGGILSAMDLAGGGGGRGACTGNTGHDAVGGLDGGGDSAVGVGGGIAGTGPGGCFWMSGNSHEEGRVRTSISLLTVGTAICVRVKALLGLPAGTEQHIRGVVTRNSLRYPWLPSGSGMTGTLSGSGGGPEGGGSLIGGGGGAKPRDGEGGRTPAGTAASVDGRSDAQQLSDEGTGGTLAIALNNRKEEFILSPAEVEWLVAQDDLRLVRTRSRQWFAYGTPTAQAGGSGGKLYADGGEGLGKKGAALWDEKD
ncbi:ap2 domain transcription factor ap2ix-7 [Cystoisospora suis]|uniref:Ap2 domain transcription factor ap2ix-7 n=1 Tax=Cystoisospora suis TaxID=483139 RepID=A0A2C6L9D8_9APIC|nr:ap2 domain transcription factor ap2ix-7 [Cystoisospora suis]